VIFLPKNLDLTEIILISAPNNRLLRMKKSLLIFSMSLTLMLAVPSLVAAIPVAPGIEEFVDEDITITVNGQTVTVTGGQGQTLEVVSLTGRRVMAVKVETPAQKIELNVPKGCYILKIGKVVRKVSVR
jgi:hypothetical protein